MDQAPKIEPGRGRLVYDKTRRTIVASTQQVYPEMIGRRVRFRHQASTGPDHSIKSVSRDGMITLADMSGEFAPDIFILQNV